MSETKETHVHVLEDGTILEHSHGEHGHHHSHAQTKAVLNRLSRAIGHLESIKRMVEDGRDCSEVLIQLSAVKSAINNTGKIILPFSGLNFFSISLKCSALSPAVRIPA